MTRKIVTIVLMTIFWGCIMASVWGPTSTAVDWWDRMYSKQSDLMYKYSSFYTDPTKYPNYWSPWSTISQRYYPTTSDLAYKYTPPTTNPKYGAPPDLSLRYMDMLPSAWNQRYSLPSLKQGYTSLPAPNMCHGYSLPPPSVLNQSYSPAPTNLDFKYLDMMSTPNQRSTPMVLGNGMNRTYIDNITSRPPYVRSSLLNSTLSVADRITWLNQGFRVVAKLWDYANPIQRETQLVWDFSYPTIRVVPERPLPTSTVLRTARDIGLDILGLAPAVIRDVSAVREGTYRLYTSHTLETGAFLLLSKAQMQIGVPLTAIGEFTRGLSSQIGRWQLLPNRGEATSYLDALNEASWYAVGAMTGGPGMGSLLSSAARLVAKGGRWLTMPMFQAWADRSVYRQKVQDLKILNNARIANGLEPLSLESVYKAPKFERIAITKEFSHHYDGPANLSSDMGLSQIDSRPIKPLDVSTLSPATQRLFADMFQRGAAARMQVSDYLSSLRTPALNKWFNNTSRMFDVSSLLPSSSFNPLQNVWLSSQSYRLYTSYSMGYLYNTYSSYSWNRWSNYNYGYNWGP